MKILLVDDSKSDQFYNYQVINNHLKSAYIMQANDGKEAFDILKKGDFDPDVILLDINMPIMDGFQFLDEASKNKDFNPIVFILSSSHHEKDLYRSRKFSFVKGFFIKPLSSSDLQVINIEYIAKSVIK